MNTRRSFLRSAALGAGAAAFLPHHLTAADTAAPIPADSPAIPRGEIIDWHTHWIGPRVDALLLARRDGPRLVINDRGERYAVAGGATEPAADARPQARHTYDIDERLRHLDEVGVSRQLISSVHPAYDGILPPQEARAFWRAQNDDLAELVRRHPKRFFALATLPTADIAAAAEELDRAHRDLGLIGATLPLDAFIHLESARALAPIFSVAQRHGSHIYIHRGPAAPSVPGQTPEVGATNAYFGLPESRSPNGAWPDLPGDHAIARATLVTSTHLATGVITLALTDLLEPYPDVTVQFTMNGGSIAHVIEAVEQRTSRAGLPDPTPRLRRLYYDTGATGRGPRGIALTAGVIGADRILFGSDYGPWPSIEPFVAGVASAGLPQAQRDAIYVGNGRALLEAKGRA